MSDPLETYRNLAIHEMGHNLGVVHEKGDYSVGTNMENVTPMATVYAYNGYGFNDTCFEPSKALPDNFCTETNSSVIPVVKRRVGTRRR